MQISINQKGEKYLKMYVSLIQEISAALDIFWA